jgi:hypothetical protein
MLVQLWIDGPCEPEVEVEVLLDSTAHNPKEADRKLLVEEHTPVEYRFDCECKVRHVCWRHYYHYSSLHEAGHSRHVYRYTYPLDGACLVSCLMAGCSH